MSSATIDLYRFGTELSDSSANNSSSSRCCANAESPTNPLPAISHILTPYSKAEKRSTRDASIINKQSANNLAIAKNGLEIGKLIEKIVSEKTLIKPKAFSLPKRYVFVMMCFFGLNMIYALRVNLSVAIVSMVKQQVSSSDNVTSEHHQDILVTNNNGSTYQNPNQFEWNEQTQGLILGSFFWGYVVTQLPGGRIADTLGSKWILGYSILLTSIFTIVSPMAAKYHYNLFLGCRVLEGLFEGVAFPAIQSMLAKWLPPSERSLLTAIVYSGSQIGTMITMPVSAILCNSGFLGGWPSVFYFFGLLGIVWSIFWYLLIYEKPEQHPNISQQELRLILQDLNNDPSQKKPAIPWKNVLTSVPLWALMITHFGQNWGYYTLLTQLPRFLKQVLGFDLKKNGFYSSLPYLFNALVGCSMGFICDKLYRTKRFQLSTIRKASNTIGFIGPACCLYLITLIERDPVWSIILIITAMGFNGTVMSGFQVTHVDMSPNFAGTLMGITNCFSNFAGIFAPYSVGLILSKAHTEDETLQAWHYVFYLSSCVYLVTAIVFILFSSNKLQKWNNPVQKRTQL